MNYIFHFEFMMSMLICVFMFSYISGRKHLLATLLSLEGMMMCFFGAIAFSASEWGSFLAYTLAFLTFVACEGALGLSILVTTVRWWGEDTVLSLNMLGG